MKIKNVIIGTILGIIIIIFLSNAITVVPKEDDYIDYLNRNYNKEFIINEKIDDISSIDFNEIIYWEEVDKIYSAYDCYLKDNPKIKFIVGYAKGRIVPYSWGDKMYFDNYRDVVEEYLIDKYYEVIHINDYFDINETIDYIENIVKDCEKESLKYGLSSCSANLKFNIYYYNRNMNDVEFWSTNRIRDILLDEVQVFLRNN